MMKWMKNTERIISNFLFIRKYDFAGRKTINNSNIMKTYEYIKKRQDKKLLQHAENPLVHSQQATKDLSNKNVNLMNIRCQGCNVYLQSANKTKYGYIDSNILNQALDHNRKSLQSTYNDKIQNKNTRILDCLHEVEKQSGITIFNEKNNEIENLDNVQVIMRLEQKLDKYEEQEQLTHRSKKNRKDILCFRCFSLKYHNRLPQEYDNNQGFTTDSTEFILNKVFNRHKNNQKFGAHYFLVVDVCDILGTMPQNLLHRLLKEKLVFSIIVNKVDIINTKYLSQVAVHSAVKKTLQKHLNSYENMGQNQKIGIENINIFYLSSKSKEGFKKFEKFLTGVKGSVQLVGLPNTGKTTLINSLARIIKSTSKIPGTTIKVTGHEYGRGHNRKIFDMPGLFYPHLLYNLITKPSIKSMLTWQKKIAPGIMTNSAIIYGGKIQIKDVRIIVFGLGGACSSDNRWFLSHLSQFWKGLPPAHQLKIKKHEFQLQFINGVAQDLQIAGYGFIGFRLSIPNVKKTKRNLILYLPEEVEFRLRGSSILTTSSQLFHNKSAITKNYMLQRLYTKPKLTRKQKKLKMLNKDMKKKQSMKKLSQGPTNDNKPKKQFLDDEQSDQILENEDQIEDGLFSNDMQGQQK